MSNYLSWAKHSTSIVFWGSLFFSSVTFADSSAGFALSEHWAIGQQVELKFDAAQAGEKALPLHLKNGLELSFGDIITLGDLYGISGKPISHGLNSLEKQGRFKNVFDSFSKSYPAVNEVKELNAVVKKELAEIEAGIEKGETAEEIYKRIGAETGREVNCITGGGCNAYTWWLYPGRYLLLAMENYDHFSPNNLIAYKIGHKVALNQALKAKKSGNRRDLELAYAMDAFACHFLADNFAAGHIRTPRSELKEKITPAVLGSLLANYMHNEENIQGIHVGNALGEQWIVYGDFSYFNPLNRLNRKMLLKTLQQSANEVFDTYYTGSVPIVSQVLDMIPHALAVSDENNLDITPMFYWDEQSKQLFRRADLSNPYDKQLTTSWWGWSTLGLLRSQYGIRSTLQLSLTRYLSQYKTNES